MLPVPKYPVSQKYNLPENLKTISESKNIRAVWRNGQVHI